MLDGYNLISPPKISRVFKWPTWSHL